MALKVTIHETPPGSRLIGEEIHTGYHLDVPIPAADLHSLITAAARSPDENPRCELSGVLADRIETGVRVRVVANQSHFDIPWNVIAQGIKRQ